MSELEQELVDVESVNRILEIATNDMEALEEETYNIVQYATLTFDYHASFDKISQALEVAEPGVTNRFVSSYEKTRETIRF